MTWTVEIYDRSVVEEIDAWPLDLRSRLLHIVDRIEAHGLERVGMPLVRHLRGKLWEMRPSGKRLEGRALYVAVEGRRIVTCSRSSRSGRRRPAGCSNSPRPE